VKLTTPSSAEIKNVWHYTSFPQDAFMAWCSVKVQGQLYLFYLTVTFMQCYSHTKLLGLSTFVVSQFLCHIITERNALRFETNGTKIYLHVSRIPQHISSWSHMWNVESGMW